MTPRDRLIAILRAIDPAGAPPFEVVSDGRGGHADFAALVTRDRAAEVREVTRRMTWHTATSATVDVDALFEVRVLAPVGPGGDDASARERLMADAAAIFRAMVQEPSNWSGDVDSVAPADAARIDIIDGGLMLTVPLRVYFDA